METHLGLKTEFTFIIILERDRSLLRHRKHVSEQITQLFGGQQEKFGQIPFYNF